jgi:uncharacterized iron-regulated membrane protein
LIRQPQNVWARRALFQVHLWSGIILGLYILMISVTGSIVVYSNEMYRAATRAPIISHGSGPRLSDEELTAAALRLYPEYKVVNLVRMTNADQAVTIWLQRSEEVKKRLFDPRAGTDLGDSVPPGIKFTSGLLSLHDDLFAGPTGRKVNGIGAICIFVLSATGLLIWWPGIKTWRRSLTLHRGVGWKRMMWHLHSMIGFWSLAFVLIFAFSGIYLSYPETIQGFADRIEPVTDANLGNRVTDSIIYWLAYLHFGRINGIGIPCKGPGICDQATKAVWAFFGLMPAALFVTGAIMWWNRVLRPRKKAAANQTSL